LQREKMNILRMVNPVMPYVWGSCTFIQNLTGKATGNEEPQAELWMGAHPKAPSRVLNGDKLASLYEIITEAPDEFLGSRTARTYQGQLPFLLKVLAAEQPLSIQAHPNRKQAKEGFARENKLHIPLDAPNRNYKDPNPKPELLVALTNFEALCGFRNLDAMKELMQKFLSPFELSEIDDFIRHPNPETLKLMYQAMLKSSLEAGKRLINLYLDNLRKYEPATTQEKMLRDWSFRLQELYPYDIGVLSPLLLNIIVLKPFQGLFLEAGVLHSYLCGAGMEIMANSDNVLRGGLTSKHIDTDELLRILNFTPHQYHPLKPVKISEIESRYETSADEFCLSVIIHKTEQKSEFRPSNSPEILFCYEGKFEVENCSQILSLEKGQSLFVPYEIEGYILCGTGTVFRAKVNLPVD